VIREDETLGEVKERLQKKLQVPDEEFAKVGCYSLFLKYKKLKSNVVVCLLKEKCVVSLLISSLYQQSMVNKGETVVSY
jgi:hypothetical protein